MFQFLKSALLRLVALFGSDKFKANLLRVETLAPLVLPYVKQVAELTATTKDDALVAKLEAILKQPVTQELLTNPSSVEGLLKSAARTLFRQAFPNVTDADHVVDAALQIAYLALRAEAQ